MQMVNEPTLFFLPFPCIFILFLSPLNSLFLGDFVSGFCCAWIVAASLRRSGHIIVECLRFGCLQSLYLHPIAFICSGSNRVTLFARSKDPSSGSRQYCRSSCRPFLVTLVALSVAFFFSMYALIASSLSDSLSDSLSVSLCLRFPTLRILPYQIVRSIPNRLEVVRSRNR